MLLQLLGDTSIEAKAGSRLNKIVTSSNQLQDRHVFIQKEKLLMSEVSSTNDSESVLLQAPQGPDIKNKADIKQPLPKMLFQD